MLKQKGTAIGRSRGGEVEEEMGLPENLEVAEAGGGSKNVKM